MVKKKRVPIIFEDDAIIVCEKPAGMPVQSDHTRDLDVLTTLKHHIFEEQAGEEEPYLTVVHRLDRPVGGLMVLAKTKEAAASLSKQIQEFEFEKNYQAVVCGNLKEDFGTFEDYLLKNGKTNKTEVVKAGTPDAKKAELDYELIDCIETKKVYSHGCLLFFIQAVIIRFEYSLLLVDWAFMVIQSIIRLSRKRRRSIQRLDYTLQDYPSFIRLREKE